jgi:hypothetical protein
MLEILNLISLASNKLSNNETKKNKNVFKIDDSILTLKDSNIKTDEIVSFAGDMLKNFGMISTKEKKVESIDFFGNVKKINKIEK